MDDRLLPPAPVATRREFCATACQALTLLGAGVILDGCGGGEGGSTPGPSPAPSLPSVNGTLTGNVITVPIDPAGPLGAAGGAATVRAGSRSALVARLADGSFSAFSTTCTHEACTITGYSAPVFQCPCHGSQFNTSGGVVRGPAGRSLPQYATSVSGDMLSVTT